MLRLDPTPGRQAGPDEAEVEGSVLVMPHSVGQSITGRGAL